MWVCVTVPGYKVSVTVTDLDSKCTLTLSEPRLEQMLGKQYMGRVACG